MQRFRIGTGFASAKLSGGQKPCPAARVARFVRMTESEFLFEGTDFEFHCPCARILVREMPVGLGDRVGLEKVAVFQAGLQSTRTRDVDAAIDVDPRHVDTS